MGIWRSIKHTLSRNRAQVFRDSVSAGEATRDEVLRLSRADLEGERGVSGTLWAAAQDGRGGLPVDPVSDALSGVEWFAAVDLMRRSGGQVPGLEQAVKLPILSTEWSIEGESDELRELVRANLLDDSDDTSMSTTWADVLRRAINCVFYGLWAFELVWKEAGGVLVLRRLADRLPHTITAFVPDGDGGLEGIVQTAEGLDGEEVEVAIPISKLLLLPWQMEGDNWHGLSILRGAYKHWRTVDTAYALANIGLSHNLNNVPLGTVPAETRAEERQAFLDLLSSAQQGEAAALIKPAGYEVEQLFTGATADYLLPYIQHHEQWIARVALADFLQLGESARTFGAEKIRLFLASLEAVASHIESLFNRHLVRRMVLLNAPTAEGADLPRLMHQPPGRGMDLEALGGFLETLTTGQWVAPDPSGADEDYWRAMLGLPERAAPTGAVPAPVGVGSSPAPAGELLSASTSSGSGEAAPAVAGATPPSPDGGAAQEFADPSVGEVVRAVRREQAELLADWEARAERHAESILRALLAQIDSSLASGDTSRLGAVSAPEGLVLAWGEDIARWLGAVRVQARVAAGLAAYAARTDGVAEADRVRGLVVARHLAEAAVFEVVQAALDGASAEQIAQRYVVVVNRRLAVDLDAAAAEIVEGLDATA